jgi:pimeloyl-ACP methyl ester carboxylesterase
MWKITRERITEIIKSAITNNKIVSTSVHTSVLEIKAQTDYRGTVVCLHGFPDQKEGFIALMEGLACCGFDVWVPAMPGYEIESAEAQTDFYITSISSTIIEWINCDLKGKPFHLIGHDWGGVIGSVVAAQNPKGLLTFTCLAIPPVQYIVKDLFCYIEQVWYSRYMILFQFPVLTDFIIRKNKFQYLKQLWKRWSPEYNMSERDIKLLEGTFSKPKVFNATLSYYRTIFKFFSSRGQQVLKQVTHCIIPVPCLFLSGKEDGCISARQFQPLRCTSKHYPMGAEHYFIKGGHFCQYEAPEEVLNHCMLFWSKSKTLITSTNNSQSKK